LTSIIELNWALLLCFADTAYWLSIFNSIVTVDRAGDDKYMEQKMTYGSEEDELSMSMSMGSDDLEEFGMMASYEEEEEQRSLGNCGYGETYEMSSDELSFEDGEDCVDDFGNELEEDEPMSYEDFQFSQRNDEDSSMEERIADCHEEDDQIYERHQEYEQGWSEESCSDYEESSSMDREFNSSREWCDVLCWYDMRAFGLNDGCGCENCRNMLREQIHDLPLVKVNSSQLTELHLRHLHADGFSDDGWRLLGKYIGNNNQLTHLDFSDVNLTDEITSLLSIEMQRNRSVDVINFGHTNLGVEGIRGLAPVLSASMYKDILCFDGNARIKDEELEIILRALASMPVRVLFLDACGIVDITISDGLFPTHVEQLTLCSNMISSNGCRALAQLLQREDSTLKELLLCDNHIDNEGAEILANSLRRNKSLTTLDLRDNRITGHARFLSLVNDVSSIKTTLCSNHTLENVNLGFDSEFMNEALTVNATSTSPEQAGRRKVIDNQLNIIQRAAIACLQGVQNHGSLFSDIDCPVHLLPEILVLIGENHRLSALFAAVLTSIGSLTSLSVSKEEMLNNRRNNLSLDMRDIAGEIKELLLADRFSREDHFRKENLTHEMGIVFQEIVELDREIASLEFAKRWNPPRKVGTAASSKRHAAAIAVDELQE